jgi:prophage tail gpP-like protein
MTVNAHKVSVIAQGKLVPGWKSYNISTDILQPADAFSLEVQFTQEAWQLLRTDEEVSIFIDNARILTGYIGTREKVPGDSGTMLRISGRDKVGRLVDESSELFSYGGLHLKELAELICDIGTPVALFEKVTLVNDQRNLSLARSVKKRKPRFVREPWNLKENKFRPLSAFQCTEHNPSGQLFERPPIIEPGIFKGRARKKRVQVGQTRWAVLEEFIKEARLLAWSTADGKELFIGLPAYDQTPEYSFFEAAAESGNRTATNCSITVRQTVEEMYALYVACGAAKGKGVNYGPNVIKNQGRARDYFDTDDGTGNRFLRPKTLLISDDGVRSQRDATERAEREQLQREAAHLEIVVSCVGHSQIFAKDEPVVFAVDKMCKVHDEDTGTKGDFYITAVDYHASGSGTRTEIRLVPHGTLLSL